MLKRFVIFVHRWLGVGLCAIFLLWFPSGIVMMYWGFPEVTPADRLMRSAPLDSGTIRVSPAEAYASSGLSGAAPQVRLNTFDGRPVYRFRGRGGDRLVYADTGEPQGRVSDAMRNRIAAAWTRQSPATARVEAVTEVDQWTVAGGLRTLRPLWKYSWPDGQQVYIAGASGEVMQYTTRAARLGAYLGAIPHWLYFTPLRTRQVAWSRVVMWTSGIGTATALLGLVIGVWMYSPKRRYRAAGAAASIPYQGQKRWHMILGLVFGLGAATWAFSGLLSMEPFPLQSGGARLPGAGISQALRGRALLASFDVKPPSRALEQLGPGTVKELEFASFDGTPFYLATLADGTSRIVSVDGEPETAFDTTRVISAVTRAAAPDALAGATVLTHYDTYYRDRLRERPLPVILATFADPAHTRYYIDPGTARVVGSYSSRSWMERWLYHGLHSLDFPWLYNYRPAWDIVVIVFMIGGTALSVTSLVLAWRVVGRKLLSSHV